MFFCNTCGEYPVSRVTHACKIVPKTVDQVASLQELYTRKTHSNDLSNVSPLYSWKQIDAVLIQSSKSYKEILWKFRVCGKTYLSVNIWL